MSKVKSSKGKAFNNGFKIDPKGFCDRNLKGTSPLKEQFEPTDQKAVRARYKMGGGC